MAGKRRLPSTTEEYRPLKHQKRTCQKSDASSQSISHPVLGRFYPKLITLRQFISTYSKSSTPPGRAESAALSELLDRTLVGVRSSCHDFNSGQLSTLCQQLCFANAELFQNGTCTQSDLVDMAIFALLGHASIDGCKTWINLLCQGYQRGIQSRMKKQSSVALVSKFPNAHAAELKSQLWSDALSLAGAEKCNIFLRMVMYCGVFVPVTRGSGNFRQVAGFSLADISTVDKQRPKNTKGSAAVSKETPAGLILFVRSRMLHARPALNAKGQVTLGLRHIHVLNRCNDLQSHLHTIHLMKYIFPRQFGLHNVFTSSVDRTQTTQAFVDYTLRENEINDVEKSRRRHLSIPKRLRGHVFHLLQRLRTRHNRCSYNKLLHYYCPLRSNRDVAETESMANLSTPVADVSAFVCAAITQVIPQSFFEDGSNTLQFRRRVMQHVDRFVRLRKFEKLCLHEVLQGVQLKDLLWIRPAGTVGISRISRTDFEKRRELLSEFLYYLFDSFVIPLIRSNFFVTESQAHGNELFFYRHDVWKSISDPQFSKIRLTMFEEVPFSKKATSYSRNALGCSQVRLLPKARSLRPIMNLRKRPIVEGKKGRSTLGKSINTILAPVHKVFKHEASRKPEILGASLFSVNGLYPKLKSFKAQFNKGTEFYLVKVDVQSCFDSIPQDRIIDLINGLDIDERYKLDRHAEVRPPVDSRFDKTAQDLGRPARKFEVAAHPVKYNSNFNERVESSLSELAVDTVFIENTYKTYLNQNEVLDLIRRHVKFNTVKIGKKYFRQRCGIPQGSALSTILCSIFYAEFERRYLGFLKKTESLLVRLIDDFLLVTTNRSHATRFLTLMTLGSSRYGISTNPSKSLATFDVEANGSKIPRPSHQYSFPYCGNCIDPRTLDVSVDLSNATQPSIRTSLTVEAGGAAGRMFHRKALNSLKLQLHSMLLDTKLNSFKTVVTNVYQAFARTAMKFYRYFQALPISSRPKQGLQRRTIEDIANTMYFLIRHKTRKERRADFKCSLEKLEIDWLAFSAFKSVLQRKQSSFGGVVDWVSQTLTQPKMSKAEGRRHLSRIIRIASTLVNETKY